MDFNDKCSSVGNIDDSTDAVKFNAEDRLIAAEAQIRNLQDMLCSVLSIKKPLVNVHRATVDGHKQIRLSNDNAADPVYSNVSSCSYKGAVRLVALPFV